jgi:hypothetical protein
MYQENNDDEFPTKNKKRALRRHFKHKMKEKAYRIAKYIWKLPDDYCVRTQKLADNLQFCQCRSCAMDRKLEGPTIAEQKERAKGYE